MPVREPTRKMSKKGIKAVVEDHDMRVFTGLEVGRRERAEGFGDFGKGVAAVVEAVGPFLKLGEVARGDVEEG